MTVVNFIIAIIALIVAVPAYQRAGGVNDLKNRLKHFTLSERREPIF